MTNPLDPAVEAEVEELLKTFAIKTHQAKPGQDETHNFEEAKTALTRLLLRERVSEANRAKAVITEFDKHTSINQQVVRAAMLEAQIKEL